MIGRSSWFCEELGEGFEGESIESIKVLRWGLRSGEKGYKLKL